MSIILRIVLLGGVAVLALFGLTYLFDGCSSFSR
jgi:hypothetical protein